MDKEPEIRVKVKHARKEFVKNRKNKNSLETFIDFLKMKKSNHKFAVLDDISLAVRPGRNLGIIGKNGSGKSTLLRAIAGVYSLDSGEILTNGELVYLTGFSHGLNLRLTMKENIFLCGSLMGLSQDAIRERFDEIVDFSGLKEELNTRLIKFSSGMQTRLASAIGLHCISHKNPDILLIDEVLGGGADKDFRAKSIKKMEELMGGGASVILVSHDMGAIKKYCNRVLWMENGKIIMRGKPEEVVEAYKCS
jgi:ABC-type polysaccharide/polyol phosphate transport system ATPase subunit